MAEMREARIDKVYPNRRLIFHEETILRLCDDIKCRGLQEPIIVELVDHYFEIVDGEKRWRACKKNGLDKVKVKIID